MVERIRFGVAKSMAIACHVGYHAHAVFGAGRSPFFLLSAVGLCLVALLATACAPAARPLASPSPSPDATPAVSQAHASPESSVPSPSAPSVSPLVELTPAPPSPARSSAVDGFAFEGEDVLAYYAGQGYTCGGWRTSTVVAGMSQSDCVLADDAGRRRLIRLVVDADGALADGWAGISAADDDQSLAPIDALESLAGFLGAMLGEERGAAVLPWFAEHLGDEHADTEAGALRIATYTRTDDDTAWLYVEVARPDYLDLAGFAAHP
jgi:hypothetical protein